MEVFVVVVCVQCDINQVEHLVSNKSWQDLGKMFNLGTRCLYFACWIQQEKQKHAYRAGVPQLPHLNLSWTSPRSSQQFLRT